MANIDAPSGLTAIKHMEGGTIRAEEFTIASDYATVIANGDLVTLSGTGRNITKAGTTGAVLGVFTGCDYYEANGEYQIRNFWPGNDDGKTGIRAFVLSDPRIEYKIQADGDLVAANIGQNANWAPGTVNTLLGRSGGELNIASLGSTATLQLKILGLTRDVDNAYGTNAKARVMLNAHVYSVGNAGV